MIVRLIKTKSKSKKQKEFLKKIKTIKEEIRNKILTMYLEKCKSINALRFFEWRRKLMSLSLDKA